VMAKRTLSEAQRRAALEAAREALASGRWMGQDEASRDLRFLLVILGYIASDIEQPGPPVYRITDAGKAALDEQVRCRWSKSGKCELGDNPLAAAIHGNKPGGDACAREGGEGFCYLDTK